MLFHLVVATSVFVVFPFNMVNIEAKDLGSIVRISYVETVLEEDSVDYGLADSIRKLLSFYNLYDLVVLEDMAKDLERTKEIAIAESIFEDARIAYNEKYSRSEAKKTLLVPYIPQIPDMHMGCELASSSMMLEKWGISVSKAIILEKLQSYRPQWTFYETPSAAYSEINAYNPHSSKFSIVFPEQMVPVINEILKEQGRRDLVATAIYDFTMNDLDHLVSNYKAPVVIYGGYPIDEHGHVVLYVGNNIVRDPWTPYGSTRHFSRDSLWYAMSNGGNEDDRWHVTGQTYGFVVLRKKDYEELKKFSKIKLGSQTTKAQIAQRKTKVTATKGKKYKLEDLYLITRVDGSVFVGYRRKTYTKPTKFVYLPVEDTEPVSISQKFMSKEKIWEIFPKKLSSSQRKKGLTYDEVYEIIEPLMYTREKSVDEDLGEIIMSISEMKANNIYMNVNFTINEVNQRSIHYQKNNYPHQQVVIPLDKYEVEIQEEEMETKKKKPTAKKQKKEKEQWKFYSVV